MVLVLNKVNTNVLVYYFYIQFNEQSIHLFNVFFTFSLLIRQASNFCLTLLTMLHSNFKLFVTHGAFMQLFDAFHGFPVNSLQVPCWFHTSHGPYVQWVTSYLHTHSRIDLYTCCLQHQPFFNIYTAALANENTTEQVCPCLA